MANGTNKEKRNQNGGQKWTTENGRRETAYVNKLEDLRDNGGWV